MRTSGASLGETHHRPRSKYSAHAGCFRATWGAYYVDSLIKRFGIPEMYRHLLQRWLERLAAAGMLRVADGEFVSEAPLPDANLAPLIREMDTVMADDPHLLAYLRNCGEFVTRVIAGTESPLQTLFPGGSSAMAEKLYAAANGNLYSNCIVGAIAEAVSRSWTMDRPLRILEVGAGTGGTPTTVLPLLDKERTEYVFTDVSDRFSSSGPSGNSLRFRSCATRRSISRRILRRKASHRIRSTSLWARTRFTPLAILMPRSGALTNSLCREDCCFWLKSQSLGLVRFHQRPYRGRQHFSDNLRGYNPRLPPESGRPPSWNADLLKLRRSRKRARPPIFSASM